MKKLVAILLVLVLCVSACTYAEEDWVCPNCGEENDGTYCGECGFKRPDSTWICPKCGTENRKKYCTGCGEAKPEASAMEAAPEAPAPAVQPGDIVTFGTYADEPIEWQVLEDKGDGTYVLLSVMGLDMKQYNTERKDVTWETCTLRAWLNDEFYETAFSASEKGKIVLSTVENPDNKTYGTKGGNTTKDYVYLLSLDEIGRYFHVDPYAENYLDRCVEALICLPTQTAVNNGAFSISQARVDEIQSKYSYPLKVGACRWWLRSPGYYQNAVADGDYFGYVNYYGCYVDDSDGCVRPVICVRF